jgi:hypothetical protein
MKEFWNTLRDKFIRWLSGWGNPDTRDFRYMLWFFYLVISTGLIAVGAYNEGRQAVTPMLWALACLLCGAFVGFLFGIPKILQTDAQPPLNASATQSASQNSAYRQQVNTNLTEISDWLTKIIVGLGLIDLKEIPPMIKKAAVLLATSMHEGGPDQDHLAYAVAIIISFSVLGFLFGYLVTRLFLAGAFSRADQDSISGQQNMKLSDFQSNKKIVDYSTTKELNPEMKKSAMHFFTETRLQAKSTEVALEYYLRHSAERDPMLDKDNLHYFRLKFWLDADNAGMLNQVDEVVYVLHPTFENPIREVNDRQTSFAMDTFAWGEFNLKAVVHLKNGKPPLTLERYIDFGTS